MERHPARQAWAFLAAGVALIAFRSLPGVGDAALLADLVLGVGATAALVVGVRRHRPDDPLVWWMVIASAVAALVGNALGSGVTASGPPAGFSPGDTVCMLTYPLLLAAVLRLVRRTRRGHALDSLLQGSVVGFAVVAAIWLLLPSGPPTGDGSPLSLTAPTIYPVADIAVIALCIRLLPRRREQLRAPLSLVLLIGAVVANLAADVGYLVMTAMSSRAAAGVLYTLMLVCSVLVGTAGLHPSIGRIGRYPRPPAGDPEGIGGMVGDLDPGPRPTLARAVVVATALLVPAVVAGGRGLGMQDRSLLVVATAEIVLVVLAGTQIAGLVRTVQQRLDDSQRLQQALAHQLTHDALTGLPNREQFTRHLDRRLTAQGDDDPPVAVLLVDLDRFKAVNDHLGHEGADQVLRTISERLAGELRTGDRLARFGGDEFVVLLDGVASGADAEATAERLLATVRAPVDVDGRPVVVTATVALALAAGTSVAAVLRDLDAALLDGKDHGRDLVVRFDRTMRHRLGGWLDTENELREGLAAGDLRLHYQPEVDLTTGTLFGVEALLRWQHARRGLVPPADFLAVAEGSGLIVPIGQWVMAEACRQARHWRDRLGDRTPPVSVNVSPVQLVRQDVAGELEELLGRYRLPPSAVRVEVTETALVSESPRVTAQIEGLHNLGVDLAVDDFGTGFFTLAHLKRLRVDLIKIDRSFVAGIGDDPVDETIIRSVVDLARRLGVRAIAEGVETPAQARWLRAAGCGVGQGFLYAHALPADELERAIAEGVVVLDRRMTSDTGGAVR